MECCHLGGFVGSDEAKQIWIEEKVETLVEGVKRLAVFAREFLQMAYVGLTMYLRHEFQFVQRVTPGVGTLFAPLEEAMRDDLLQDLLGDRREEVTDSLLKRIN